MRGNRGGSAVRKRVVGRGAKGGQKELDRRSMHPSHRTSNTLSVKHTNSESSKHTGRRGTAGLSRAMVKVAVKWNKRVFADVEVTPKVADFKAKLQELTVRNTHGCIIYVHPAQQQHLCTAVMRIIVRPPAGTNNDIIQYAVCCCGVSRLSSL